jgi:hypothetical protein
MLLLLIAVSLKKLWRCDVILWLGVQNEFRENKPDESDFERGIQAVQ